jgi:CMP-N,N'-diacetyllegionaminic acid synthase
MRILALIPARGGSKRLPRKNMRALGGKPLITWSIDAVNGVEGVCDILVSTDDSAIAEVAKAAGALVPWLRPAELATDTANSVDVALHALQWYERNFGEIDGLLLLQPTSPFRKKETIIRGIDLFQLNERKSVLGVSPTHSHPLWTFQIVGNLLVPYFPNHSLQSRSQDLPPAYVVNGAYYLVCPSTLRSKRSFLGDATVPLLIPSALEALDIDTEWDWEIAELTIGKCPL